MSAQLAQALKSTLRIDYENDTGPGDEGFWEWWSVIDEATGETLCKCDDEATAKRILAALAAHEAAPQAQAPQDWLHLKPYGYAPGNYMSRCSDCGQTPAMDKRATRCRPCAEAAFCKTQQAPQQEPAITVTIDDLDLVQDWAESRLPPGTHKLYAAPQQAQAPSSSDYVIELLKAAGHVTAEQVERARAIAAQHYPLQQAQAPGWQPIETAPRQQGVPIMVSWPVHELDDEDMPTGPILRRVTLITEMNGSHWLDPDVCNASGAWFGDEYAYAEQPDLWQPLPPAPQQGSATE